MKFQWYLLSDDEIIRKNLNIGCLENVHLLYYKRYNQQRENEKNHNEQNYTYINLRTTPCHMSIIEEENSIVHQYIVIIPFDPMYYTWFKYRH